jgi:signal transduction histidine kinase
MSVTESDAAARVAAAIRRERSEILHAWAARVAGNGGGPGGGDRGLVETAESVLTAVCDRLDRGQGPAPRTDGRAAASARGAAAGSARPAPGSMGTLHLILLERAAAELQNPPVPSLADAFGVSVAICEALGLAQAEPEAALAPVEPAAGAERFETFARTIAHELKNPLGAARGAAELLSTGEGLETAEDRARFAQLVLRNVNRALELLDDVRSMAEIAATPGAAVARGGRTRG